MRFLFIGPGYPGAQGTSHGSGIGTYMREMCLGLMELGHECHVVAWRDEKSGVGMPDAGCRLPLSLTQQLNNSTTQQLPFQEIHGVKVFLLPHAYWPLIERFMPDSRDVWNMRRLVRRLDAEYHYDWIEIQSEEGIGIGVQRDYPDKAILRAHTTLRQMVEYKGEGEKVVGDRLSVIGCWSAVAGKSGARWKRGYRLWRERRSFALARRIVTHSVSHADEIKRLYPGSVAPVVVRHGVGAGAGREELLSCQVVKLSSGCLDTSAIPPLKNSATQQLGNFPTRPTFLIVGTPDRRKGFDRIMPVLQAYVEKYGPCRVVIVAGGKSGDHRPQTVDRSPSVAKAMEDKPQTTDQIANERKTGQQHVIATTPSPLEGEGWGEGVSSRITIDWKTGLSTADLAREYEQATVYLHLARYESFGIPLIEAASHGVPVVSTRVGIAPELLTGDLACCLVEGNETGAIAEALERAVRARGAMSQAIYSRYEAGFTRARMATSFLAGLQRDA